MVRIRAALVPRESVQANFAKQSYAGANPSRLGETYFRLRPYKCSEAPKNRRHKEFYVLKRPLVPLADGTDYSADSASTAIVIPE